MPVSYTHLDVYKRQVLYGIYSGDDAIVKAALSQVGNAGGEPYWSRCV